VVTICTTSLIFINPTFCPQSVFMCFVWIWEQTAIISPYSINWLVFITETECVYCAVRTGSVYMSGQISSSDHAMHQVISCRHLTAQTRVRFLGRQCENCGGQIHAGSGFSPSSSVFPCQYHSTNAPYPFTHLPPTIYNVSLPVIQFSPVSTIPPMLHTHSFTYHPHYIMFLSQHFSFPLSVPFH